MFVSVSHRVLARAGHESIAAALADLRLAALEVVTDRSLALPSLDGATPPATAGAQAAANRAYRAHLYRLSARLSALAASWGALSSACEDDAACLTECIGATEVLGAPVLGLAVASLDAGARGHDSSWPLLVSCLQQGLGQTRGSRVAIALEFQADPLSGAGLPPALTPLFESERVGLTLDPGALYRAGLPGPIVHDLVRELAPLVRRVLCRNFRCAGRGAESPDGSAADNVEPCPLEVGGIDYGHIACLLGRAGYAGALTVANAPPDDAQPSIARRWLAADIAFLRDLLGEAGAWGHRR